MRARDGIFHGNRFLHADLDLGVTFPADWATQNTPSAVRASSPERDALIAFELQGAGSDPQQAAAAFAAEHGLRLGEAGPLRIGDLRAYHASA